MKGESKGLRNKLMIIYFAAFDLQTLQHRLFACDIHLKIVALSADRHMNLRHLRLN